MRDAIDALERGRKSVAIIVGAQNLLRGVITDGDVRRSMLAGAGIDTLALAIATTNPVTALVGTTEEEVLRLLAENALEAIPIVDEHYCFVRTAFRDEMIQIRGAPESAAGFWAAVIMAGGQGRRLRPYTNTVPKPMLRVGGMPLIERNIRSLSRLGVPRFFISINYLGHLIEDYFGDGSAFGTRIDYLRESRPLGTAGAIRLIEEVPVGPVLVMNGDLVTGLEVGRMLALHEQHDAAITVAAKEYRIEIPFGVLRHSGPLVTGLVEKPSERFLCNAGIYVLDPEVFSILPTQDNFDMTTLIEYAIAAGVKVVSFPMVELWKDIGTPQQLDEVRSLLEPGALAGG